MLSLPIIFLGAESLRGDSMVTCKRTDRSLVNIAGEAPPPDPIQTHGSFAEMFG